MVMVDLSLSAASSLSAIIRCHHHRRFHRPLRKPLPSLGYHQRAVSFIVAKALDPTNSPASFPTSSLHYPCPAGKTQHLDAVKTIAPFVLSEWRLVLKGWACSVVSVVCLSNLVPLSGELSALLPQRGMGGLVREGMTAGALLLVRLVVLYWHQAFLWEAALNMSYRIRIYCFQRVLHWDLGCFEGSGGVSPGDIAHRIAAEAADLGDTIYVLLHTTIPSMLQLFAMAIKMIAISPLLSMATALVVPCLSFVIAYFGKKLRAISRDAHVTVARLSSYLNEVLCLMILVKVNSAEACEMKRFQKFAQDDLRKCLKKKKMKAAIPLGIQFLYLGGFSLFCIGSLLVTSGTIDGSRMVSFVMCLFLLVEPIQGVGKAYNEMKQGEPAIERLFDLTTFLPQVKEEEGAVSLNSIVGSVKFHGVSFKYNEKSSLILNKLNIHIEPGEIVAVFGPSGGGKTTLIKLLLRLYDPIQGNILVDGIDIRNIKLDSLRQHIALVPQDLTLFAGTVAENIAYRDLMRDIDMEKVVHASKIANADEFIMALPDGYNTNIGQRGSLLSGGQKQRLAIARAIYQNSSIIILDEATSALDDKSELLVRQALKRVMHNRTVLVIAHRSETILMADRIFLLEGGILQEIPHSSFQSSHCQYVQHNSASKAS
ncbi:ABC transporter B family member 29, chloroplastic isoform X2 [Nymphaea colorata]|uniref:ABC transporter B family member 29, chloroplastic isoform X2 n=1 Tax=Nymphaea colorata TaxID=210225 RepID=UPI00129DB730|nr:ABC transporter B family member 29, chloroplastic isoform X2 [Nymphaea colorata]